MAVPALVVTPPAFPAGAEILVSARRVNGRRRRSRATARRVPSACLSTAGMALVTEERGHSGPPAKSVPRLDVQSLVA
jgi:hypothetical protein